MIEATDDTLAVFVAKWSSKPWPDLPKHWWNFDIVYGEAYIINRCILELLIESIRDQFQYRAIVERRLIECCELSERDRSNRMAEYLRAKAVLLAASSHLALVELLILAEDGCRTVTK